MLITTNCNYLNSKLIISTKLPKSSVVVVELVEQDHLIAAIVRFASLSRSSAIRDIVAVQLGNAVQCEIDVFVFVIEQAVILEFEFGFAFFH